MISNGTGAVLAGVTVCALFVSKLTERRSATLRQQPRLR
jgi:hypothetical protein